VCAALGGLAQINPVWIWRPFQPAAVSAGSQPDWYVGWLEGSLRLLPGWETRAFGHEIPNPFYSGVLLPGITFVLLYLWPFLEARFTRDRRDHHLLDRPRDRPVRTAIGVGALAFYAVLFVAGGNDVLAARFDVSVNLITDALRVALFVVPIATSFLTYRLCKELSARSPIPGEPEALLGGELIIRTEDGGYVEVEEPVGPARS
jgi:ubiquinol-cytochrome c reductase cytochrome b subunit